MSDNAVEMYMQEDTPSNELKGFTKSFQKRSKDKKVEDKNVVELLSFNREKKLVFGAKVAQKMLKNSKVKKIYTSLNPNVLTLKMINHYSKIGSVEVVKLDLDNEELGQKLGKPFNVSIVSVRND
jgi:ribosomal protein L30E